MKMLAALPLMSRLDVLRIPHGALEFCPGLAAQRFLLPAMLITAVLKTDDGVAGRAVAAVLLPETAVAELVRRRGVFGRAIVATASTFLVGANDGFEVVVGSRGG